MDKYFGNLAAVNQITLAFEEGEFFTLVGPSGSGKTTLLRMLAGMDKPTRGDILLRGERINDRPANLRPTCMVFQSLALFPHMTVGGNVEYPLKCRGTPPSERKERAARCLEISHLPISYYDRPVTTCSGGERQRVALARALAFDPEILFFDEPLSAIDYRLRKTLEKEIKDIQRETKKTFVYITHSLEEAMVMSDRIGVMRDGGLAQIGSPHEIYSNPVDRFVSEFMGYHGACTKTRMDTANVPCYLAGHIHVGGLIDWGTAHETVKISLREVIKVVDYYKQLPGDINNDGVISITDLIIIVFHILGTNEMSAEQLQTADLNFDLVITIDDVLKLADIIMGN